MINKQFFIFVVLVLLVFNLKVLSKEDISISYKVNDEIITNIDIKKEAQYLIALNNQLTNLEKNEILEISKESAIREKIKKIELLKFFILEDIDPNVGLYIERIYLQLKLNNKAEF